MSKVNARPVFCIFLKICTTTRFVMRTGISRAAPSNLANRLHQNTIGPELSQVRDLITSVSNYESFPNVVHQAEHSRDPNMGSAKLLSSSRAPNDPNPGTQTHTPDSTELLILLIV